MVNAISHYINCYINYQPIAYTFSESNSPNLTRKE